MMNVKLKHRGLASLVALALLPLSGYANEDIIGGFTITENEISGDCDNQYDDQQLSERERRFRRAVCEFHQADGAAVDANIQELQTLQTLGLASAKQALAAMMEGLSHCQIATDLLDDIDQPSTIARFCDSRAGAIASFSSIQWRFASFSYASDASLDAGYLLEGIAACYEDNYGPLNTDFDGTCGVTGELTDEQRQTLVDNKYQAVSSNYFGGTAPVTQLFVEKKNLAEKNVEQNTERLARMNAESSGVSNAYNSLLTPFQAKIKDPDNPYSPLDVVVNHYKQAYVLGRSMLDQFSEWERGLLEEKKNSGIVVDHGEVLSGPNGKVSQMDTQIEGITGPRGSSHQVSTIAQTLSMIGERRNNSQGIAKQLCQVYYCHLTLGPGLFDPSDYYLQACQTTQLYTIERNPLCEIVGTKLEVGNLQWTAKQFCQYYGFDVANYGQVGMDESQTAGCFD